MQSHAAVLIFIMQGVTTPFPRFVKLNPNISDMSLPELQARVEKENHQVRFIILRMYPG